MSWGLSQVEVGTILAAQVTGSFDLDESEDEIVESDNGSDRGEDNAEFIEEIEIQGIINAYNDQRSGSHIIDLEDTDRIYSTRSNKRHHRD